MVGKVFGFCAAGCKYETYTANGIENYLKENKFAKICELTEAEFDALTSYAENTIYIFTDAWTNKELYNNSGTGSTSVNVIKSDFNKCSFFAIRFICDNMEHNVLISKEQFGRGLSVACSNNVDKMRATTVYINASELTSTVKLTGSYEGVECSSNGFTSVNGNVTFYQVIGYRGA